MIVSVWNAAGEFRWETEFVVGTGNGRKSAQGSSAFGRVEKQPRAGQADEPSTSLQT